MNLFQRWSSASRRLLSSYCCVIFHFRAFHGYKHWYVCDVVCFIPLVMLSSSDFACQFHYALVLGALRFLFNIVFFLFIFHFLPDPASGSSAGAGSSKSASCSRDTRPDPTFPVSDLARKYGACFSSPRFAGRRINGDNTYRWEV